MVGHQVPHARGRQEQADREAVADLAVESAVDLAGVLDLLLQRGDDPEGVAHGPLAEELQKAHVFVEASRVRLGAQELGELVEHQHQALGMARLERSPEGAAVARRRVDVQCVADDSLEAELGGKVEQRHRLDRRRNIAQGGTAQGAGQVGKEVRLAGAVGTDQEDAGALRPGQHLAQRLQVVLDVAREVVRFGDPRLVEVAQTHHGGVGADLDPATDRSGGGAGRRWRHMAICGEVDRVHTVARSKGGPRARERCA